MNRTKRTASTKIRPKSSILRRNVTTSQISSIQHLNTASSPVIYQKNQPTRVVHTSLQSSITTRASFNTRVTTARRTFSTAEAEPNATPEVAKPKRVRDPVERFQTRNNFMRRRHLDRDHIIHTQYKDVRILAIKATEALREATQRHKMTEHEATVWGGYMTGTSLYAGLLRGDDRVILESFLGHPKDTEHANHFYIEVFGAGEIRGFANITQEFADENGSKFPGIGSIRLTKAIYQHKRKYQSTVLSRGDPMLDWQHIFDQSEQLPTYIQTETIVRQRTPDDPRDIEVEFCGAVLVQSLGGPSDEEAKVDILTRKPLKRLEEETDDQYVKRCQVNDFRNKILDLDLVESVKKRGVSNYVGQLVGVDVESIGYDATHRNTGNIHGEFDYELLERALLSSALREKPLFKINKDGTQGQEITDFAYQHDFIYKPVHFFCRCYQTPPEKQLLQFPTQLLEDLAAEKGASFSCDFCAHETVVGEDQLLTAIQNQKDRMMKETAEMIATPSTDDNTGDVLNSGKSIDVAQSEADPALNDSPSHEQKM